MRSLQMSDNPRHVSKIFVDVTKTFTENVGIMRVKIAINFANLSERI